MDLTVLSDAELDAEFDRTRNTIRKLNAISEECDRVSDLIQPRLDAIYAEYTRRADVKIGDAA